MFYIEGKIKCIASDLDRTLLNEEGELSPATSEVLKAAIDAGIEMIAASGRPYQALPDCILSFPGIRYAIVSNGAAVCTLPEGKRIYQKVIASETVLHLLEILEREKFSFALEAIMGGQGYSDAEFVKDPIRFGTTPGKVEYIQTTRIPVSDMRSWIMEHREELESIDVISAEKDALEDFRDRLGTLEPDLYRTSSVRGLLELSDKDCGKKNTLLWLLAELGIASAETAAFGDADNDSDMLSGVGYGIAVDNSSEACREAARLITGHHAKDGVADAVRHILDGSGNKPFSAALPWNRNGVETLSVQSASPEDLEDILSLQQLVCDRIDAPEWFVSTKPAAMRDLMKKDMDMLLIRDKEKLIAYGNAIYCGKDPDNYAAVTGVPEEEWKEWLNVDTILVHPDYRGGGLQKYLFDALEQRARKEIRFLAGTVCPDNRYSLNNFLKCGYENRGEYRMYGGMRRYLMVKEIRKG